MEIGIDSFAAHLLHPGTGTPLSGMEAMSQLLDRIERADQVASSNVEFRYK